MTALLIFLVAAWAGAQNALGGGGSFLILPTLMFAGLDARAANITSCVALFPAQVATGWTGRALASGAGGLSLRALFALSIFGGGIGAVILLSTPAEIFARLVPWLVLFATAVFAWGSFIRKANDTAGHIGPIRAGLAQLLISIYGGYFGGGIGFLMVAALTFAGASVRVASATKNVLAGSHERIGRDHFSVFAGFTLATGAGDLAGRDAWRSPGRPLVAPHRRKTIAHSCRRDRLRLDHRFILQGALTLTAT